MEHLDIQLAHRLIRGQLDAEEHARWQGHLENCPRCRSLVAGERA
jgi:anti-sigma factor RsiW